MTLAPKIIYGGSLLIWCAACFVHYYFRTTAILSGPHDSDAYAYSWSFQTMVFSIFCLPFWIGGLVLVLFAEVRMLNRKAGLRPGEKGD